MKRILALMTPALLTAELATAQVVISEVCPDPAAGQDVAEWVEVHNLGEGPLDLVGYALSDHLDSGDESPVRWTFAGSVLVPPSGVAVIARQARAFAALYGAPPEFELAEGDDDPQVPNLTASNGVDALRLSSRRSGDAVVLRDATGAVVDAVEWGTLDRPVPGIPLSAVAGEGQSFVRVRRSGSSQADFVVTDTPSPGVGFEAPVGPVISMPNFSPAHIEYPGAFSIEAMVTDADGLAAVEIGLATATSSRGEAATLYVPLAMLRGERDMFRFEGTLSGLAPSLMFAEPATFHERYLRYFIYAEDDFGNATTQPLEATEWSTSAAYYERNVVPTTPSRISEIRAAEATGRMSWLEHSARIRGVVVSGPGLVSGDPLEFAVADAEGWGVRVAARASASALGPEPALRPGQAVEVLGEIAQVFGTTILERASITVTATAAIPTSTVTVADLLTQPERFESRLVTVLTVRVSTGTTAWGAEGMAIADATGELPIRIFGSNGLASQPTPTTAFHVRGVFGQRTEGADGAVGGYFLTPRGPEDLMILAAPEDEPVDDDGPGEPPPDMAEGAVPVTSAGGVVADEGCSCSAASRAKAASASLGGLVAFGLFAWAGRRRSRL